jgi:hypothetical protein
MRIRLLMTELSPAASAVWEAFNQDEAGVFVDYGDKLAAALRAAADQMRYSDQLGLTGFGGYVQAQDQILAIAAELEGTQ